MEKYVVGKPIFETEANLEIVKFAKNSEGCIAIMVDNGMFDKADEGKVFLHVSTYKDGDVSFDQCTMREALNQFDILT